MFDVQCNVPVKVRLQAEQGAFKTDSRKTPEHTSDFTNAVDYMAGFTLPIGGLNWTVSGVPGNDLIGGKDFAPTSPAQSKTPPFDTELRFSLDWGAPVKDLIAGTYRETITITVTGADPTPIFAPAS